jgi:hypothetical protein
MDITTKFQEIALGVDTFFHSLNNKFNPAYSNWSYGRGLEQASGMGFWFVAVTMLLGSGFGFSQETIGVNNFLWAWMALILGFCQIYYNGVIQRKVFDLMATAAWITMAISAYGLLGGWNLVTAISLPYCLCSFYVYGFLIGGKPTVTEENL